MLGRREGRRRRVPREEQCRPRQGPSGLWPRCSIWAKASQALGRSPFPWEETPENKRHYYLSCSPQPRRGRLAGAGLSSAVCGLSAGASGPTDAQGVPRITCPGRLSSGNRGGVERVRAGISEKDLAVVNPSQPAGCVLTSPRCFSYQPGDEIWKAPGIFK